MKIYLKFYKYQGLCFSKHPNSPDVFENTYNEFYLVSTNLKFPCPNHKNDISDIFTTYIVMRMRQYTYSENQKTKKINRMKKKISKLTTTQYLGY